MDLVTVYFIFSNSLIIHKENTKEIGHLHSGVILLLRPEFSFSYVNLEAPVRFE